MRMRLVAVLSLTLALASVAPAWAGCLQSDLRGPWRLYVIGATSQGLYTLRCAVRVGTGSGGNFTGGSCIDDAGDSGPVTGGRLRVTSACAVTGNVTVSDVPLLTIVDASLDQDKGTMAGVGEDNTGGIFQFSGIKR